MATESARNPCPVCSYELGEVAPLRCPECGAEVAAELERRGRPKGVVNVIVAFAIAAGLWGFAAYIVAAINAFYTKSWISLHPIVLAIDTMAITAIAGLVASVIWRDRLRHSNLRWYGSVRFFAWFQAITGLMAWGMILTGAW